MGEEGMLTRGLVLSDDGLVIGKVAATLVDECDGDDQTEI